MLCACACAYRHHAHRRTAEPAGEIVTGSDGTIVRTDPTRDIKATTTGRPREPGCRLVAIGMRTFHVSLSSTSHWCRTSWPTLRSFRNRLHNPDMPNPDPMFLPSRLAYRFLHEYSHIIHPLFPVHDLAAVDRSIAVSFDTSRSGQRRPFPAPGSTALVTCSSSPWRPSLQRRR